MFKRILPTGIAGLLLSGALAAQTVTKEPPPPPPASYQEMNALLGLELWQDATLWDADAQETCRRLRWPEESRTTYSASYRSYPDAGCRVLACRPFSMALYADPDKVAGVSLIFANKGDSVPLFAEDNKDKQQIKAHRQSIDNCAKMIKDDTALIKARLQSALGDAAKDAMGAGARTKEKVERWDWNGHSILLSAPRGEYVRVQIVPTELADVDGMAQRVSDKQLRELLVQRVVTRANGDVVIADIPMVSQGQKGYCVPATWERYLRYLGIPADMHVLALAGGTAAGGGTSSDAIVAGVAQLVQKYKRAIHTYTQPVNTPDIAKWIDKGFPLMWCITFEPDFYEQELTERAQKRSAETEASWAEQVKVLEKRADHARSAKSIGHHMCLVIGYNPATKEIAISDSWGPAFAERWLTQKEAKVISENRYYVIQW